jgi:lipopolysaccharide export system permease protein
MAYLVQASVGAFPAEFILRLVTLRLLGDLMLLLPLGFFLALLIALGRLYKDNEITAMAACGIPVPTDSIIGFGALFAVVIAFLSLMIAPWAESQRDILQAQLATMAEVGGIAAGRFKEFNHGNGIFYVETMNTENNVMNTLFVQVNLPDRRIIMVAKEGSQVVEEGELFMVLRDGSRYESTPGRLNFTITHFAEHRIRIPKRLDGKELGENRKSIRTYQLLQKTEPVYQAELQWRLSLPLTVILLAALAVPISRTMPRQGQYANILAGILIYLIYNNLLNVAKKWVETGEVHSWIGVWWVHLGLLWIIIALFHWHVVSYYLRQSLKWVGFQMKLVIYRIRNQWRKQS